MPYSPDTLREDIRRWYGLFAENQHSNPETFLRSFINTYYPEHATMPFTVANGQIQFVTPSEARATAARAASRTHLVKVTDEVPARPSPQCDCKGCKLDRHEPCDVRAGMLRSYSYEPRPWRLYETKQEAAAPVPINRYYLGVELETDLYRPSTKDERLKVFSKVDPHTAIGLRQPKQLWIAKRDGSVSGPEFVSHPATLAYWTTKQSQIGEMFTDLVHAGYRSYDTDRCGMHINLSRTAFAGDYNHLFRFISLIYGNPQMSLRLSQRTTKSANMWARLDEFDARKYTMLDVARNIVRGDAMPRWSYRPRSTALNSSGTGSARLEFRLPRGTLRLERFYKNLEWVAAMVEFSREAEDSDMKAKRFLGYVTEHNQQYPNLFEFMKERTRIALPTT